MQTPSEHLFCEDELLEWLTRSDVCPATKTKLNPASIRPPGRIILNMLGEIERYCPNKSTGCKWTGPNSQVDHHVNSCQYKSREDLLSQLEHKDIVIDKLKKRVAKSESMLAASEEACLSLQSRLEYVETKLKVYDAFFRDHGDGPRPDLSSIDKSSTSQRDYAQDSKEITLSSDLRRFNRLQQLSLVDSDSDDARPPPLSSDDAPPRAKETKQREKK